MVRLSDIHSSIHIFQWKNICDHLFRMDAAARQTVNDIWHHTGAQMAACDGQLLILANFIKVDGG